MKQKMLDVLNSFISLLHYVERKGSRYVCVDAKSMYIINSFANHENVTALIPTYNKELLLP
jgi:hypothetical protein